MKNKYVNRSKISEAKFRDLVRLFCLDLTAIQIAELSSLNRNTVNRYLSEIRKKIVRFSTLSFPAAPKKIPVYKLEEAGNFSILIREFDTMMYTEIIPSSYVFGGTQLEKTAFLDDSGFDLIINLKDEKHVFIGDKNDSIQYRTKINRIESFWGSAKTRLAKFKGMHSSTFRYHMKECEFRFNNRDKDLYQLLLKILRKDPLF